MLVQRSEATRVTRRARRPVPAATILDMLGLPSVEAFQGQSLLPVMKAPEAESLEPRPIFAEMFYQDWYYARSLSTGSLKLIETKHRDEHHVSLFDLDEDPQERNDLASLVAEEELSRLKQQLYALYEDSEKAASESAHSIDLEDEMVDQFRALGYIIN